MRRTVLAASLVLIAASASAQPKAGLSTLQMDSDRSTVTATMRAANAQFGIVAGAMEYNSAKPEESTIALSLDTTSLVEKPARDAFDAEHFPELRISSSAVAKKGSDGREALPTNVTIRDITKLVIFQVSFHDVGNNVIAMHAEGTVRSADFKMNGKSGDVELVIDAPFNRISSDQR